MIVFLQLTGGVLYTISKLCFSLAERAKKRDNAVRERSCRALAWILCIVGLPPFLVLFAIRHNWIAAGVEVSGVPAMLIGLLIALKGVNWRMPRWLEWFARLCIVGGFTWSLLDFHGITDARQLIETTMVAAFLIGTYQVAHKKRVGYRCYVVMHAAMATLCAVQSWWWLTAQQILSIVFVVDAYRASPVSEIDDDLEASEM